MRHVFRKILPLGAYMIVTVVTIVVVASSTNAWLKENTRLKGSGLKLQLEDARGIAIKDAQYYQRDGKDGAQRVTERNRIDMTEYDMIFTDRNVDTPIIIRVALDDINVGDKVRWSVQCGDVKYTWLDKNGRMLKYYSNITAIRVGTGSYDLNSKYDKNQPEKNIAAIYDGAVDELSYIEPQSFTSEDGPGTGKDKYQHLDKIDELSGYIVVEEGDLYEDPDDPTKDNLILYIELSYSDKEVAAFMEDYEQGAEDKERIDFESDLSAVRFTIIGAE